MGKHVHLLGAFKYTPQPRATSGWLQALHLWTCSSKAPSCPRHLELLVPDQLLLKACNSGESSARVAVYSRELFGVRARAAIFGGEVAYDSTGLLFVVPC